MHVPMMACMQLLDLPSKPSIGLLSDKASVATFREASTPVYVEASEGRPATSGSC